MKLKKLVYISFFNDEAYFKDLNVISVCFFHAVNYSVLKMYLFLKAIPVLRISYSRIGLADCENLRRLYPSYGVRKKYEGKKCLNILGLERN